MAKTTVVNLHQEEFDVYIGRAGHGYDGTFGNPFLLAEGESRGATIQRFKTYFLERVAEDPDFRERVIALKGKRLGCFCAPHPCHGDVIAAWLDGSDEPTQPRQGTFF